MDKIIRVTCQGAQSVDFRKLVPLQGNLKSLAVEDFERLKKQILEVGFSDTFNVWPREDGYYWILDGHQRLRVVDHLVTKEGFACPPLPITISEASSLEEAVRKLLGFASQYGRVQSQGLYEFQSKHNIDFDEMAMSYSFVEIDFQKYRAEYDPAAHPTGGGGDAKPSMADKFMIPPFSVFNAREGWWQDRKTRWISLGIKSELGRGGATTEPQLERERERESSLVQEPGSASRLPKKSLGAIPSNQMDLLKGEKYKR